MTTIKLFLLTIIIIPSILFAQFTQQGPKLVGTGAIGGLDGSMQGISVAISADGNTAIVGGYADNGFRGAAWIFIRSGGAWTQQGPKLVGTGVIADSKQGYSVAISADGNTAAIGGYQDNTYQGAVWIFTRTGGVWTQQGNKLVGTGSIGNTSQGWSVALSSDGNTLVEGGYQDSIGRGAIWIFTRSGGVWNQQGNKLVGSGILGAQIYQGASVSISGDGNTVVEGGPGDNISAGASWIFTRTGGVWTQLGQKLLGTGAVGTQVGQGASVSISADGNTIIEGGAGDNNSQGAIWVFILNGGVWTQQGSKLAATGGLGNIIYQGHSVSISSDGNTFLESGYGDSNHIGAAWTFTRSGSVWTQQIPKLIGTGALGKAWQGYSVALSSSGNTAIIGGYQDDTSKGAAWFFANNGNGITPISNIIPEKFSLSQNYPNPFNPSTNFEFRIAKSGLVSLKIYDVLGREISTLVDEELKAGTYKADFDGSKFTSGIYFYKLSVGNFSETKKMMLIK